MPRRQRIHDLLPSIRLVAILRNPIDRALSWYPYALRSRYEQLSFGRFLDEDPMALAAGFYHQSLTRYLEHLQREQVHVMIYGDLVRNPARELNALARFLGLDRGWEDPEAALATRVNTSAIPKFRRAYAALRHVGKLLMLHDLNWPGRVAKRLGIRSLFGAAEGSSRLGDNERDRLAPVYQEDAAALAALLGREAPIWRL